MYFSYSYVCNQCGDQRDLATNDDDGGRCHSCDIGQYRKCGESYDQEYVDQKNMKNSKIGNMKRDIGMIDIEQFAADPSRYIYGDDCRITVDSIFDGEFNGDLKLLLTCCEDNVTSEGINYYQTVEDYKHSREKEE